MLALWILLGVIGLIVLLTLFTSTDFDYAKSITINAPKEKVWKHISSLRALEEWNPWSKKDPNIKQRYEGEDGTVGSQYFWESDHKSVGHGRQEIKSIETRKQIENEIEFIKPRRGTSTGFIKMEGEDGNINGTWSFHSKMPRPFNLMKLVMNFDKLMDADFSRGLNDLQKICEGIEQGNG